MIKQTIKQFFCRHNFIYLAKHKSTQQNLWMCDKCGIHLIQHYGIGVHYKCKQPNIGGWIYERSD